ncbi:MAG: hypothetical protein AAF126_08780 [Chloroflexota bacterium]
MADNDNKQSVFTSPPVIGAMITGVVTIIVAVITLSFQASPAPAPQVVTATPVPEVARATEAITVTPSDTPIPTSTDSAEPTQENIASPIPPTHTSVPEVIPNITLLYDDVAFTVHNISGTALDLSNLSFSSSTRTWNSTQWGANLVSGLPANNCLRMRDVTSGNRRPPAVCGDLYAFVTVAESVLFWLEEDTFAVVYNDETIATCDSNATSCEVAIP